MFKLFKFVWFSWDLLTRRVRSAPLRWLIRYGLPLILLLTAGLALWHRIVRLVLLRDSIGADLTTLAIIATLIAWAIVAHHRHERCARDGGKNLAVELKSHRRAARAVALAAALIGTLPSTWVSVSVPVRAGVTMLVVLTGGAWAYRIGGRQPSLEPMWRVSARYGFRWLTRARLSGPVGPVIALHVRRRLGGETEEVFKRRWGAGWRHVRRTVVAIVMIAAATVGAVIVTVTDRPGGDVPAVVLTVLLVLGSWRIGARASVEQHRWWKAAAATIGIEKISEVEVLPSGFEVAHWEKRAAFLDAPQEQLNRNLPWSAGIQLAAGTLSTKVEDTADKIRAQVTVPWPKRWKVDIDSAEGVIGLTLEDDPLARTVDWPFRPGEQVGTLSAVPLGVLENGDELTLPTVEANWLVGGLPGGGKSGFLNAALAGICSHPNVAIIGLDPKLVELAPWAPRLSMQVEDAELAVHALDALIAEMNRRYRQMKAAKIRKVEQFDPNTPLIIVVIDELAELVAMGVGEPAADKQRASQIQFLIQKGRAAGIVVIAATQKPAGDTIPTRLRDLFKFRIGFSTSTSDMTDTILGAGMSGQGGLCHEIPPEARGVGFVLTETSRVPKRFRAYWVTDEQVSEAAASSAHLRVPMRWLEEDVAARMAATEDDQPAPRRKPAKKRLGDHVSPELRAADPDRRFDPETGERLDPFQVANRARHDATVGAVPDLRKPSIPPPLPDDDEDDLSDGEEGPSVDDYLEALNAASEQEDEE